MPFVSSGFCVARAYWISRELQDASVTHVKIANGMRIKRCQLRLNVVHDFRRSAEHCKEFMEECSENGLKDGEENGENGWHF